MSFAHPTGPVSDELREFMTAAAGSAGFRRKVNFAWRLNPSGVPFPRGEFHGKVELAEFREFEGKRQALCFGWAGQNPNSERPQWLFGLFHPFWRRRRHRW